MQKNSSTVIYALPFFETWPNFSAIVYIAVRIHVIKHDMDPNSNINYESFCFDFSQNMNLNIKDNI
jgi:hypothetical protein